MRKARQVVVNSLQLAYLNSMGSAWCMGTASDCLVSGPTSVQGLGSIGLICGTLMRWLGTWALGWLVCM